MGTLAKAAKELEKRKTEVLERASAEERVMKYTSGAIGTNLGLYAGTMALMKNPWQPAEGSLVKHVQDLAEKMGLEAGTKAPSVEIPKWYDIRRALNPYYSPGTHSVNIPNHASEAIILHELGHAKNFAQLGAKDGGKYLAPYEIAQEVSRRGSGVTLIPTVAWAAMQKDKDLSYTPGVIQAILSSPMLAEEAAASARAVATLVQEHGALKGVAKSLPLLPAFGTYATIAAAPLVVTYLRKRALAKKQALEAARLEKRSWAATKDHDKYSPKEQLYLSRQALKSSLRDPDGMEDFHREDIARLQKQLKSKTSSVMEKIAQLPGGKADRAGKTASDFNPKALRKGMRVEREHTTNTLLQKAIAEDHLTEDPKYYEKLRLIEKD